MKDRRLSVPLSSSIYLRLQRLIPWGQRATIIVMLIEQLCDIIEESGGETLVKLYSGRIKLQEDKNANISAEDAERAIRNHLRRTTEQDGDEE